MPVAGDLGSATAELRSLLPKTSQLVGQFDALTKRGAEPSQLLLQGTQGLRGKVERLIPTAVDLVRLARIMDEFRNGGAQLADTLSGATSVNDNGGTYGQVDVLELEDPKPGNVGLPASAARSRNGHLSELDRKLVDRARGDLQDQRGRVHPALPGPRAAARAAHRRRERG